MTFLFVFIPFVHNSDTIYGTNRLILINGVFFLLLLFQFDHNSGTTCRINRLIMINSVLVYFFYFRLFTIPYYMQNQSTDYDNRCFFFFLCRISRLIMINDGFVCCLFLFLFNILNEFIGVIMRFYLHNPMIKTYSFKINCDVRKNTL